jgi:hypothetical protein
VRVKEKATNFYDEPMNPMVLRQLQDASADPNYQTLHVTVAPTSSRMMIIILNRLKSVISKSS